ncbi:TPA: hypothetical protein ACOGFG_001917 [Staphylococcus aureus]|nr:hypothetical protein [Staphylococcus aureus]HDK9154564.1 hypothetical protein [Staphylococcus aureus]HDR2062201.1 hypothetical protein [Staphylococcus aureus]
MIKFEIKDRKTGKTESYTKEAPNATKMRQKERQLLVDLFKDEGLTEEDVLNKMSTKTYTKALQDIFREINGEDEEDSETEPEEMGKTEE